MITSTFSHIRGLSRRSEEKLWAKGILAWSHLDSCPSLVFSANKMKLIRDHLVESKLALERSDAGYFLDRLPPAHLPRVYPHLAGRIAYLDIETTGLDAWSEITTIAVYDGIAVKTFVRGTNLDTFPEAIGAYSMVVTYNGARFDLPFIRRQFGIAMDMPHLDVMRPLRAHGYKGGLKLCERLVGIRRQIPEDIDGFEAVRLWFAYRRGNPTALAKLLAYNSQDAISLETLLIETYNLSMKGHPLFQTVPLPQQPKLQWPRD